MRTIYLYLSTMRIGNRSDEKKKHDHLHSSTASTSASSSDAKKGVAFDKQKPGFSSDRVVSSKNEGILIQNMTTHAKKNDGLHSSASTSNFSFRLQSGQKSLPRSVQKSLHRAPHEPTKRLRTESSSPEPSSPSNGTSRSSSEEIHVASGKKDNRISDILAKKSKTRGYALHEGLTPSAQRLDGKSIRANVESSHRQVDIEKFIVSQYNLPGHSIPATGDYVAHGTKVFSRVGWTQERAFLREASRHTELFDPSILAKIVALGTGRTDNFVRAYVYKNDHNPHDPTQSRQKGDVLIIDERQGLLAAFSKQGRIKTGRIESPDLLRDYLQDEKHKDLGRG